MLLSPEQQSRIAQIRAKVSAGGGELDDFKEFVMILRQGRTTSQQSSAKSRSKKGPVDVAALFDDLDKL
jgi:hypothetical protein